MSKVNLQSVGSIDSTLITAINNNNAAIQAAFDNTLSRDGSVPNPMNAALDMNSQRIMNVPFAAQPNEPLVLGQLANAGQVAIGFPTMSGDVSGSFNQGSATVVTTVTKVDGVSYPANPSTNTVPVVTGSNTITYEAVPNSVLASMANNTIKSNISGGSTIPSDNTVSAILDAVFTNTQGSVLYRSASGWTFLGPGTANQVLISGGPGQNVSWSSSAGGGGGGGTLYQHAAITGGI